MWYEEPEYTVCEGVLFVCLIVLPSNFIWCFLITRPRDSDWTRKKVDYEVRKSPCRLPLSWFLLHYKPCSCW